MPAPTTIRMTVTRDATRPHGRFVATVHGLSGRVDTWPFDWPADLNRYVQRTRTWAKRKGYELDIQDETGEVR